MSRIDLNNYDMTEEITIKDNIKDGSRFVKRYKKQIKNLVRKWVHYHNYLDPSDEWKDLQATIFEEIDDIADSKVKEDDKILIAAICKDKVVGFASGCIDKIEFEHNTCLYEFAFATLLDATKSYGQFQYFQQLIANDYKVHIKNCLNIFRIKAENSKNEFFISKLKIIDKLNSYKEGELLTLYVDENFRGKNIGGMMVERYEKWLKSNEVDRISLLVLNNNKRAINFYRSSNYKMSPVVYGLSLAAGLSKRLSQKVDTIEMSKRLRN